MAGEADVFLHEGQFLARGHQQLRLHQVDAGDHLGDRMLDLDARVHLDEEELAVLVEELQRAGAAVTDRTAGCHHALAHFLAYFGVQPWGRGLFDHLWWRRCMEQSRSPRCTTLP